MNVKKLFLSSQSLPTRICLTYYNLEQFPKLKGDV